MKSLFTHKTLMIKVLIYFSTAISHSQVQSCEELIYYRDVVLVKQYDDEVNEYKINSDVLNRMAQIREETLNDREWGKLMSPSQAITDEGLATAVFAKNIQITCKLIRGVIDAYSPKTGVVSTAEKVYNTLKFGQDIKSIATEDIEKVAYKKVIAMQNPLIKAVNIAWDFSEGMQEMVKLPEERDKLKAEIEIAMNRLDNEMRKYQNRLDKNTNAVQDINALLTGITRYLNENCKHYKNDVSKKIVSKNTTSPQRKGEGNKGNKVSPNSFFVFLSTTMNYKGKTMIVISSPILHKGNIKDQMTVHQLDFIEDIASQIKDKSRDFKDKLMQDNFNNIKVHYGKLYSTKILKTEAESFDAIDDFKQSQAEIYEGTNYNFVELK